MEKGGGYMLGIVLDVVSIVLNLAVIVLLLRRKG